MDIKIRHINTFIVIAAWTHLKSYTFYDKTLPFVIIEEDVFTWIHCCKTPCYFNMDCLLIRWVLLNHLH